VPGSNYRGFCEVLNQIGRQLRLRDLLIKCDSRVRMVQPETRREFQGQLYPALVATCLALEAQLFNGVLSVPSDTDS